MNGYQHGVSSGRPPAKPCQRSALCIELAALCAEGQAPDWVQLLPSGPKVTGRDGRWWSMPDAGAVVTASLADRDSLAIDWNHALDFRAPFGRESPAAGWIQELEVRQGGVWGRVAWTAKGRQSVQSREYRYLSPVFIYERRGSQILRLTSASLVNAPNLELAALNQEEKSMESNRIALALGLSEASTEEQVLEAVNRQTAELEAARNQTPSLDKFVPRSDYDSAVERAVNAEQQLSDDRAQARNQEIAAEISKALAAGKITPATRDYHTAQCQTDGGLERFRKFLEAAPALGGPSPVQGQPPNTGGPAAALNRAVPRRRGDEP